MVLRISVTLVSQDFPKEIVEQTLFQGEVRHMSKMIKKEYQLQLFLNGGKLGTIP